MPRITVKTTTRGSLAVGLTAAQMRSVGEALVENNKARFAAGKNVDDLPAKPLVPRYKKYKERVQRISQAFRNLRLTGKTLADHRVLSASEKQVKVGWLDPVAIKRVLFNQDRDTTVGFSRSDRSKIGDLINGFLKSNTRGKV